MLVARAHLARAVASASVAPPTSQAIPKNVTNVNARPSRRQTALALFAAGATSLAPGVNAAVAAAGAADKPVDMRALVRAFDDAMAAGADFEAADKAWTRAIDIAPLNSAAWSNRGTKRLQARRWS